MTSNSHEEQFEAFVQQHGRSLLHVAELLTGDPHRAEDLLQTALAKAYSRWSHIEQAPKAYVKAILLNAQRDWWRRKIWLESPQQSDEYDEPLHLAPGLDLGVLSADRAVVLAALATLTPRERTALVLKFYEDLSEADIASALGVARGTVKSTLSRALHKLRDIPTLQAWEIS